MLRVTLATGALLLAAACGSGTAAPAKTATPSAVVDAKARAACEQLAQADALRKGAKGEKPADGYGTSADEMRATSMELKALDLALKSSMAEVRQLDTADALRSWCQAHHVS